MFWDRVAWVYDVFADLINGKVHRELSVRVAELVQDSDEVLECACGFRVIIMTVANSLRKSRVPDALPMFGTREYMSLSIL